MRVGPGNWPSSNARLLPRWARTWMGIAGLGRKATKDASRAYGGGAAARMEQDVPEPGASSGRGGHPLRDPPR